jgi:hypothetical protein
MIAVKCKNRTAANRALNAIIVSLALLSAAARRRGRQGGVLERAVRPPERLPARPNLSIKGGDLEAQGWAKAVSVGGSDENKRRTIRLGLWAHSNSGSLARRTPAGPLRFSIRACKGEDDHDDIHGNHRTQRPNEDGVTHKFPPPFLCC